MTSRSTSAHSTHPLQSRAWGEFRKAMGVDVQHTRHGQLTFHRIPHTPFTIGYFPKGPLPSQKMLKNLLKIGKEKNAIFIQLEPNVRAPERWPKDSFQVKPSHHPLFTKYTFILDLTKSEENLLAAMHPKTRYNIRLARRHGVRITEDNSPRAFAAYLSLNEETTDRQGYYAHNRRYHETMWKILHGSGIARLFTAEYNGEILAAWIIFSGGKTLYYPYGTSSRKHREVMAPVLLLWEIALWGKKHGYTAFDLWGALGPQPDPEDPWYGFHKFKSGFNPEHVEFAGSYDLVINPILYRLFKIANDTRWFILNGIKSLKRITIP